MTSNRDTKIFLFNMRPIPLGLRMSLQDDPFMSACIQDNMDCRGMHGEYPGRVEWDHVFTYQGRQLNEWWAICPACWYHHRGGGLDREYSQFVALSRLSDEQLKEVQKKYPRFDWIKLKTRLQKKYGKSKVHK